MTIRLYIHPSFEGEDTGQGGVRRVVEAQARLLPAHGFEIVSNPEAADILASHVTAPKDFFTRYSNKPLVAHNHGFYWSEYAWDGKWAEQANAEVMAQVKAADVTTAPTEWVAQVIRRHSSRDVRVVPHGVDVPARRPKAGTYVLWNKTRTDPVCDPAAVRELAKRLPDVPFLTTFWQDEDTDKKRPNWPSNVTVTGRVGHAQALAQTQAAAVYLATTRETFGIGTLEAMAAGVPIVGFRFGGQAEIITHGHDGYLAEVGDYDDLANGVRWALANRPAVGREARLTAGGYSWENAIAQYARIYTEVWERSQQKRPTTSVIVTAYNVAPWLKECLESVRAQTVGDWECLIVEDASPDESSDVASEFVEGDDRFKLIRNQENVGVAEARNIGIRASTGRYILPLDGDDRLATRTLETLAESLDLDRRIHITYGNVLFTREDGGSGHSGWPIDYTPAAFFGHNGQPMPYCSMYRREAWKLTGGYRSRVRSSEDCDLFLRMCSYGFTPKKVTNADTLIYRVRAGSRSDTEGHADVENRGWFPWVTAPALAPAALRDTDAVQVSLLEPAIAVIIPVGPGHERLCLDAIDSLDAQTFRGWECIVIADGVELNELPSWVRVIEQPFSTGVAQARNAGIAASAAPLFLPLDADDVLMPSALLTMYATYLRGDRREIVYADCYEDPDRPGQYKVYQFADYDPELLLNGALYAVTALTPKAAWLEAGAYDGSAPWEDWDFILRCADKGWCGKHIAAPLWTYRKHTGSRRADRYQRKPQALEAMDERWGEYRRGEKKLMACSSCSRQAQMLASRMTPAQIERDPNAAAVRIRYVSEQRGSVPIKGPVTGTVYSFRGGDAKFVHGKDAPDLLAKAYFVPADEEAEAYAQVAPTVSGAGPALMTHQSVRPAEAPAPARAPVVRAPVIERPAPPVARAPRTRQSAADARADVPPEDPDYQAPEGAEAPADAPRARSAKTVADLPMDQRQ
jgi:glycosyltransferase involved in cell wall biosynthesis